MANKQMLFVSTSNSMFRASMSHSAKSNKDANGFGVAGTILIIIVPLIVWLIFKHIDNGTQLPKE